MMSNNRDQLLQAAFAEARQELDGEALTARVMAKTRSLLYLLAVGGISLALVILISVWLVFGLPMLEFAVLTSQVLTTALFELGEGWLAVVLMPVNNIASLLVLTVKAGHLGWKKVIGASFNN